MATTITTPWDPADHLKTEEDMVAYLEAALEEADPALVAALGLQLHASPATARSAF